MTERANRAAHLATCPECTAKVEDYRQAARALDTWKLPAVRPHRPLFQPALQWAAAAALVLAAGIGIGRTTSPGPADPTALRQQMRAELAQMLRQELDRSASATLTASGNQTRELLGDYARYAEESRAQDARGFFNALTQLETRRVADHASLRKDLETVAVFSDAGLRQTQQGLIQLADYRPPVTPASNPTSSGNN